jgi:hypothetical protein
MDLKNRYINKLILVVRACLYESVKIINQLKTKFRIAYQVFLKEEDLGQKNQSLSDLFRGSITALKDFTVENFYKSETGPLSLFALSTFGNTETIKYEAVRLIERNDNNFLCENFCGGIFLFKVINNSKEFIHFIPRGEDPRVFVYNEEVYVYYQIYSFDIQTTEIYIMELSSESRQTFKISHDSLFMGKNWSPFEKTGTLYFVHTYDPFFIIKIPKKNEWLDGKIKIKIKDESEIPEWEWSDDPERGFVTEFRGGSRGISINNYIYFFGHRTHKKNQMKHTVFIAQLDFQKNIVDFIEINNEPDFNIISDPFGVNLCDEIIEIDITLSQGFNGSPEAFTELVKLKFHISELSILFEKPLFTRQIKNSFDF